MDLRLPFNRLVMRALEALVALIGLSALGFICFAVVETDAAWWYHLPAVFLVGWTATAIALAEVEIAGSRRAPSGTGTLLCLLSLVLAPVQVLWILFWG